MPISSTAVPQLPQSFLFLSFLFGTLGILFFFFLSSKKGTATTVVEQQEERKIRHDPNREEKMYTAAEIAQHAKEDDAWIIVDGKVYDITEFVSLHPGGDAILNNVGDDSSAGFHGPQHPASVWDLLAKYYIGKLDTSTKDSSHQ